MNIIEPMLAIDANERAVRGYIANDSFSMEQKLDGVRLTVHVEDGFVKAVKRSGNIDNLPLTAERWFASFTGSWVFDGEFFDNTFWIFDLPVVSAAGLTPLHPYRLRRHVLAQFVEKMMLPPTIRLLPYVMGATDKENLIARLKANNAEGVMIKNLDAPYAPGIRSNACLKYKFVSDAEVIVMEVGRGGKENAVLGVVEMDPTPKIVECGKCSLIGKPPVKVGDIITVRYLYATAEHRLYQPRMMQVRDDKTMLDCTRQQFHYTNREVLVD